MPGYSDRINHALAFAAKHHDRQVHKGARPPYRTRAANVAIILARYDQPDQTLVAAILLDVIHDAVSERRTRETLDERVGEKFGGDTLELVLSITPRPTDDEGLELSHEERRDDLLERLVRAPDAARWVSAADLLHEVSLTLANLRRTIDPDSVWATLPLGRTGTLGWFRRLYDRLDALAFTAPIMSEIGEALDALETVAGGQP